MRALANWILKEKLRFVEKACEKPNIHIGFSRELLLEKLFHLPFKYRRKITITEQSGNDLTYYQVLIELNSTNFDFSHAQTNGEDIRFTDANGNLLDYWIEEWDAVNEKARIWVEVPSIPANSEIEIYCYSDDTEILTEEGWKSLREVVEERMHIKVATLNPEKDVVEYHYPTRYFKLPYKGKLFRQRGRGIDICVTPNHRLWVRTKTKDKKFRFVKAEECPRYVEYRRDFPYEGEEVEYFVLPSYENKYIDRLGRRHTIKRREKRFRMDDFLTFFGVWLAEGSLRGKNSVVISQNNPEKCEIIKSIIERLGYKAYYYRDKANNGVFLIHDVQLNQWLRQFGEAKEKYIPKEFKSLSKRQLRILLEALVLGDGSHYKNTQSFYYATTSKQLADDVHEIAIKAGYIASLRRREDGCYIIEISEKQKTPCVNQGNDNREWIEYDGYVYCVEVPNHIIYVRRNGKACWCGNCYYGNPTVASASDGGATFLLFDDFEEGLVNWNVVGSGVTTAVDGITGSTVLRLVSGTDTEDYAERNISLTAAVWEFDFRMLALNSTRNHPDFFPYFQDMDNFYGWIPFRGDGDYTFFHKRVAGTGTALISAAYTRDTNWRKFRIVTDGGGNWEIFIDDVSYGSVTDTSFLSTSKIAIGILPTIDEDSYFDNVRIRKYASPEPSVGLGNEEIA